MAIKQVPCTVVDCDTCRDGWQDEDYRCHFTTEDEAREWLGDAGWLFTPEGAVLCRVCAAEKACREQGHQYDRPDGDGPLPVSPDGWMPCRCGGLIQEPGHSEQGCTAQVRFCLRCCTAEHRSAA